MEDFIQIIKNIEKHPDKLSVDSINKYNTTLTNLLLIYFISQDTVTSSKDTVTSSHDDITPEDTSIFEDSKMMDPTLKLFALLCNNINAESSDLELFEKCYNQIYKYYLTNKISGNIVSYIHIMTSPIFKSKFDFEKIEDLLDLIEKENLHKDSIYKPLFKFVLQNTSIYNVEDLLSIVCTFNDKITKINKDIKEKNFVIIQKNEQIRVYNKYNKTNITEQILITELKFVRLSNDIICDMIDYCNSCKNHTFFKKIIKYICINDTFKQVDIFKKIKDYLIENRLFESIKFNTDLLNKIISSECVNSILDKIEFTINNIKYHYNKTTELSVDQKFNIFDKFDIFKKLLAEHKFDNIVDFANITYDAKSKDPNVIKINIIIQLLKLPHFKKGKTLLVVHQRHQCYIDNLYLPHNIMVVYTPCHVNDDWFWLYASLTQNANIITNDEAKDHGSMFGYLPELRTWLQYHKIGVIKKINDVSLISKQIQHTNGIYLLNDDITLIESNNSYKIKN